MKLGLVWLLCGIAAYLVGSIPTGLIVARAKGIDIRRVGSGNIGATNVFRSVGKGWGVFTFVCDVLKGFVPVAFSLLVRGIPSQGHSLGIAITAGIMAIAGHNWPVYIGFKGGKGIATSAGVMLAIAPRAIGIGLVSWAAVFLLTGYVSLASIITATVIPLSAWLFYMEHGCLVPVTLTVLGILAMWRHKNNIRRLIIGTENRFRLPWLKRSPGGSNES